MNHEPNFRRARKCPACRLHHPSVKEANDRCAPCLVHEKIVVERQQFKAVVEWMRSKAVCFYCGEMATDIEHVVPRVTLYPTWTVPSCRECNSLAGPEPFTSVLDKLLWIREKRLKRRAQLLRMPEWDDEEIDELGKNMRAKILAEQKAREVVASQVSWNPIALVEFVPAQDHGTI